MGNGLLSVPAPNSFCFTHDDSSNRATSIYVGGSMQRGGRDCLDWVKLQKLEVQMSSCN